MTWVHLYRYRNNVDQFFDLSSRDVSAGFFKYVENTLANEKMGYEKSERVWGRTPKGRQFVIITTSVSFSESKSDIVSDSRSCGTQFALLSRIMVLSITNNS